MNTDDNKWSKINVYIFLRIIVDEKICKFQINYSVGLKAWLTLAPPFVAECHKKQLNTSQTVCYAFLSSSPASLFQCRIGYQLFQWSYMPRLSFYFLLPTLTICSFLLFHLILTRRRMIAYSLEEWSLLLPSYTDRLRCVGCWESIAFSSVDRSVKPETFHRTDCTFARSKSIISSHALIAQFYIVVNHLFYFPYGFLGN